MINLLLAFVLWLISTPALAVEFKTIIQDASTSASGTVDYTESGFGTPKAAICMVSFGVSAGTPVSHGIVGFGAFDGTRTWGVSTRIKDAVSPTLSGRRRTDSTDMLLLADQDGSVILRAQPSWITDGLRLTYGTAPATAYKVACTLIGGSGVSNAYVGTAAVPGTIDTGTDVTDPGFSPDVVIVGSTGATSNDANTANSSISLGFALNSGSNPHIQGSTSHRDSNNVATTAVSTTSTTNRVGRDEAGLQSFELRDFDANGFTAFSRDTTGAETFGYVALKFSGLTAKVLHIDSPTSTGSSDITGIGVIPQWGMLAMSSADVVDTSQTDADGESWGMSMFDASVQACVGIFSDDAVGTSNAETVFHTRPVCLRKDSAIFYSATFTSFTSDTATFNYTTSDGTVRKWVALFVGSNASPYFPERRRLW